MILWLLSTVCQKVFHNSMFFSVLLVWYEIIYLCNAILEPKTRHQTPMTCTYVYSHFIHFQTVATKKLMYLNIAFPPLLQQFWSVWKDWTRMYKSLVFDDEFVDHLKSHQRCSDAFCRPVKFFHTDWIIISLWFLSYTQRHCHVRIEKSPVQTVSIQYPRISLYA